MRLSHRAVAQLGALLVSLCILLAPAAHADLIVPSGGSMSLGSGTLEQVCVLPRRLNFLITPFSASSTRLGSDLVQAGGGTYKRLPALLRQPVTRAIPRRLGQRKTL